MSTTRIDYIFDCFTPENALKFRDKLKRFGRNSMICQDQAESDAIQRHSLELEGIIVIAERRDGDTQHTYDVLCDLAEEFGGEYNPSELGLILQNSA